MTLATQLAAAPAASPQIIDLSCEGDRTLGGLSYGHLKHGITINVADRIVSGVSGGFDVVVRITSTDANAPNIQFEGQGPQAGGISVVGSIDRVTGLATVYTTLGLSDPKTASHFTDEMTCKATIVRTVVVVVVPFWPASAWGIPNNRYSRYPYWGRGRYCCR